MLATIPDLKLDPTRKVDSTVILATKSHKTKQSGPTLVGLEGDTV